MYIDQTRNFALRSHKHLWLFLFFHLDYLSRCMKYLSENWCLFVCLRLWLHIFKLNKIFCFLKSHFSMKWKSLVLTDSWYCSYITIQFLGEYASPLLILEIPWSPPVAIKNLRGIWIHTRLIAFICFAFSFFCHILNLHFKIIQGSNGQHRAEWEPKNSSSFRILSRKRMSMFVISLLFM